MKKWKIVQLVKDDKKTSKSSIKVSKNWWKVIKSGKNW